MGSIFDEIVQRAEKLHSDVRLGSITDTELRLPASSVTETVDGPSITSILLNSGLDEVFRRSEEIWSRKQSLRPATVGMGVSLKTSQDLNKLSSTRLTASRGVEKPSSVDASARYEDEGVVDVQNGNFSDAETNKFIQRSIERAQIEAERTFLNQQILERRIQPGESLFSPMGKKVLGSTEPDRMAQGAVKHFVNLPSAPLSHEQNVFAQKMNDLLSSDPESLVLPAIEEALKNLNSREAEFIWSKVRAIFPSSVGSAGPDRSSHNWMGHIINNGTQFLQNEFVNHMEVTIEANLEKARRGGVPGTLARIIAYLNVKMASRDFYEEGLFDRHPIWTVLFYCLRVGDMSETGRIAKEAKELSNNPHCASLVGILKDLPKSDILNDERRLKLRAEWNSQNCMDVHKKAIYGLFLGFDCPEANGTIEDWLWAKMFHCKFAVDPSRSLRQLQTTICNQHGERYFVGEGGSHLLYFSLLLLTGQIERAVHVLFKSEYIVHSVHIAILAHQLHLLMTTSKVSDELLTPDVHEPSICRLNLARLLLLYIKDFELINIEYAINYCFFAREFKLDTPSAGKTNNRQERRNVFVASVSRIVFLSDHREAILGQLDPQGKRITGLIDKYGNAIDIYELIANIAFDTNLQGHSLTACRLYALAKRHESAIKLANCQLSMCVSNPMSKETLEMVECAEWLARQFDQPNMDKENAAFATLILLLKLHSFFRLAAEGKHGEAIELIKSTNILPIEPENVQANVSQFYESVPTEVRPLLPDLCVQAMRSIVALHNDTPPASPIVHLLKQFAKALILYSAMIPYRFPISTNSLLLQLQSKIV